MNQETHLNNGVSIPKIGLGTYPMFGKTLTDAVVAAYDSGYRLIDSSDNYYNEKDLGISLGELYRKGNAHRKELFLISKVSDELYHPGVIGGGENKGVYFWKNSPMMQQPNAVKKIISEKIDKTLKFLKTDYLDLYLMHWPYPDYFLEIWSEMENIHKSGKVRAIGVCNCRERHLAKIFQSCEISPAVNQIETSPLNTRQTLIDFCNEKNIRVMVYSPLMSLKHSKNQDYIEFIKQLACKYGKDSAQIILKFDIQRGLIPIPKSANPLRIKNNIDIFDFNLSEEEMGRLLGFNENRFYLPESKSCPGL